MVIIQVIQLILPFLLAWADVACCLYLWCSPCWNTQRSNIIFYRNFIYLVVLIAVPWTVICPAFCSILWTLQGMRGIMSILPEGRHRHQGQTKLISGRDPQTTLGRAVFHHFDSQSVSKTKRNSTSMSTVLHFPRCSQQSHQPYSKQVIFQHWSGFSSCSKEENVISSLIIGLWKNQMLLWYKALKIKNPW